MILFDFHPAQSLLQFFTRSVASQVVVSVRNVPEICTAEHFCAAQKRNKRQNVFTIIWILQSASGAKIEKNIGNRVTKLGLW